MLNKLLIEQTKSRPRHSNDNGLAESKNGAVVRKLMGYTHIAAPHAAAITDFFQEHLNPYLNFHRPCGVPELVVNAKGEGEASVPMVRDAMGGLPYGAPGCNLSKTRGRCPPLFRARLMQATMTAHRPAPAVCHNGFGRMPRAWRFRVIDTVLNLLFRCSHRRLTRPVAPITKAGQPHSQSYVVCLDCGKQFEYDLKLMCMGKAIDRSHDACVVPKDMPLPTTTKVKYAVLAAVPLALVIGSIFTTKMSGAKKNVSSGDQPAAPAKKDPGVPEGE